jgi:hypothetical protein
MMGTLMRWGLATGKVKDEAGRVGSAARQEPNAMNAVDVALNF